MAVARSVVVVLLAASSAQAQSTDPLSAPSPTTTVPEEISGGRWWASLPLSTTLGLVGFAGGIMLGYGALGCSDEGTGCKVGGDNAEGYVAVALGALGTSLGAYLGGRRGDSEGELGKNVLVTAIPAVIASFALARTDDPNEGSLLGAVAILSMPIVSTIADHAFRKRRGARGLRKRLDDSSSSIAESASARPRLSFDAPVSANLGLGAGYCHPVADEVSVCGRAGYRIEESSFVDYGENQHAFHLAGGLRYLPSDSLRLEVGAIGLTTRRDSMSREGHVGAYTSMLFGYRRIFVGPELRVLGRFDDLTQVLVVGRYELPM